MGRNGGHAHANQDGSAGGRHDAVVRGGRHTHAQHDTADHGQEQGNDHAVTSQGHNAVDEHVGKASHGDGARNDSGNATGGGYCDGTLTTSSKGLQQALGGGTVVLIEAGYHDSGNDGNGGGILDAPGVGAHQIDEKHQRQQQVNLLQQRGEPGQLILAQTPQAHLLGFQMDGDEHARKIQHRRQNGFHGDLAVGQVHVVRHQEGGGTHNGRHDLSAGGSGGFRRGSKLRLVAGLFHQRDGDGAGADSVGNGGAGNHALHGADHHRHLGGAAGHPAHGGIGNVNEEIRNARALQERAENDEHHDKLGADIDGGRQDAFLAVEQVADHVVQLAP